MRKIKAALVAALMVGGIFVAPQPASAAIGDCPANWFCYWNDINYAGQMCLAKPADMFGQGGVRVGSFCNNKASSWKNNSPYSVTIIDANTCDSSASGWHRTLNSGQQATAQGSDWGDRQSSSNIPPQINAVMSCQS